MLNVDFPNSKEESLEECMDFTFTGESIDEYQCEKCSPDLPKDAPPGSLKPKRHPGTIQRRIWRLPQNLIVVLKRFRFDGRGQSKCHANFKAEATQKFEKWFAPASPETSHHAEYILQSTVDHHGSSNGGHYTAQVKSPITGLWNVYDDESVNQITDGSNAHLGAMTYILFYRKGQ